MQRCPPALVEDAHLDGVRLTPGQTGDPQAGAGRRLLPLRTADRAWSRGTAPRRCSPPAVVVPAGPRSCWRVCHAADLRGTWKGQWRHWRRHRPRALTEHVLGRDPGLVGDTVCQVLQQLLPKCAVPRVGEMTHGPPACRYSTAYPVTARCPDHRVRPRTATPHRRHRRPSAPDRPWTAVARS